MASIKSIGLNSYVKRCLNKDKPTSYFKDLRWRNTPCLVLGSGNAWKYLKIKKSSPTFYRVLTYRRSLDMNFNALKTYFSHVAYGGKIRVIIDAYQIKKDEGLIFPSDYKDIHPHIFLALGKKEPKERMNKPFWGFKKFSLGYIFTRGLKSLKFFKKGTWGVKDVTFTQEESQSVAKRLVEMAEFIKERDLVPEFYFLKDTKDAINSDWIKAMNAYDETILCEEIADAKQLNKTIKTLQ